MEIKQDMQEVADDVKRLLPIIQDFSRDITAEMAEIKDKIEETFRLATELRYKVKSYKLLNFNCFVIRKA